MMLASSVKHLLSENAPTLNIDPDFIYSYTIDPNVRANDVDDLVILITEITDTPQNYGGNVSINRQGNIQIQIFFPQNYSGDTSELRDKIRNIMENAGWYCTLDQGIKHDPSVNMLSNTSHWRILHDRKF